ncbi:MAG: hypothetical protein WCK02_00155 [Bacteroidota bacterium]
MEQIKLNKLAEHLGFKKNDIARQWCVNLNIPIYGKNSMRYVLAMDVAMELDTDLITCLIKKYGPDNWSAVYKMYKENNFEGLVNIKYSAMLKQGSTASEKYESKSKSSAKFLKDVA